MKVFDKILCAIDYSSTSTKALLWTQYLAKNFGSKVSVLHVTPPPVDAYAFGYPYYQSAADCKRFETEALKTFLQPLEIPVNMISRTGMVNDTILKVADEEDYGLLVMGTHGHHGLTHKLLGSNTESVIRKVNVPVLTVSPNALLPNEVGDRAKALLALAHPEKLPERFDELTDLLSELNLDVSLFHSIPFDSPDLQFNFASNPFHVTTYELGQKQIQLEQFHLLLKDSAKKNVEIVVAAGDPAEEILKESKKDNYKFIILGSRKHALFARWTETTVYQVFSKSSIPVLVF